MNIRHTLLAGSVVLALASLTACGSTPPVAKAQPVAANHALVVEGPSTLSMRSAVDERPSLNHNSCR